MLVVMGSTGTWAQEYAVTEVGTLGGLETIALGLNDLGQVVGRSDGYNYCCQPYLWYDGETQKLNTPDQYGQYDKGWATAINNHGQLCGSTSHPHHALVWLDLVPTILELFPGGDISGALDINDSGTVAGWAKTITGKQHAVIWTVDGIQNLLLPFPINTRCQEVAGALNNIGQVVATVYGSNEYPYPCEGVFVWQDGVTMALDEEILCAQDINDHGTIVGGLQVDAFILDHGVIYDIGKLPGYEYAGALAVNEGNVVVGTSYSPGWSGRAFVWDGVMADLNDRIPQDSDWFLQKAYDINIHGQIVGNGVNPDGKYRAYLLTPLFSQPEVSMFALFVDCLSGPYPDSPAECELFDFNDSGTIDLKDFAYFQTHYCD